MSRDVLVIFIRLVQWCSAVNMDAESRENGLRGAVSTKHAAGGEHTMAITGPEEFMESYRKMLSQWEAMANDFGA